MRSTPTIIMGIARSFPIKVVGTISPYPVVVNVTTTNQNAVGILSNELNMIYKMLISLKNHSHLG